MPQHEIDALWTKLTEHIPDATIEEVPTNSPEARFVVLGKPPRAKGRKSSQLAHGSTRREAVDRAVHLFGRNR